MSKNKSTAKGLINKGSKASIEDKQEKKAEKQSANSEIQKKDDINTSEKKKALPITKSYNFVVPEGLLSRSRAVCDECGFLPIEDNDQGWTTPAIAQARKAGHKVEGHIVDIENEYTGNFLKANLTFSRSRAYCDVCKFLPKGDSNKGWCTLQEAHERKAGHNLTDHIVDIETEYSVNQ